VSERSTIRIAPEWLEAPGVAAPELAATWSSLSIEVDGEIVTQIADDRSGSLRDRIDVPTYPLARWIVRNWFFLLHHSRPLQLPASWRRFDGRSSRSAESTEWMLHHNLRAVGEGFVWPDLTLLSTAEESCAEWWSDPSKRIGAQIRYISSGTAATSRDSLQEALRRVVEATIIRLEDQGVTGFPLADEWEAVLNLDEEEADFCVASARLGLDAFELSDDVADLVARIGSDLESALLDDFLEAAQPELLAGDMAWVTNASAVLEGATSDVEALPVIDAADAALPPPKRGLAEAARLRKELGIPPTERVDPLRWVNSMEVQNADENLVGLGGRSTTRAAVLATNGRHRHLLGRRFTAARALRDFAMSSTTTRFLVTSSRLPAQQANRAFAAEFLAPVEGITELLPRGTHPLPWEAVDEIAEHYEVSPMVVVHQIEDGVGRVVVRDHI
jgi:hypothetical protein